MYKLIKTVMMCAGNINLLEFVYQSPHKVVAITDMLPWTITVGGRLAVEGGNEVERKGERIN